MSQLTITNAKTLAYSVKVNFAGVVDVRKEIDLTVQCSLSDISNKSGVTTTVSELANYKGFTDYFPVDINGFVFQEARINSFSVDSGDLTERVSVTLNFTIFQESAALSSLGTNFAKWSSAFYNTGIGKAIESWNETLELTRGENSTGYNRSISFTLNNSISLTSQVSTYGIIDVIRQTIQQIFTLEQSGYDFPLVDSDAEIQDLLNGDYYKERSEVVDLINNTVSISESLSASNEIDDGYAHSFTQALSIDQEGIATVTQSGEIKGLTRGSRLSKAETGYSAVKTAAKTGAATFYGNYYVPLEGSAQPLVLSGGVPKIFREIKTVFAERGVITYTFEFSNDNAREHAFSISVNDDGCFISATENGVFQSQNSNLIDATKNGLLNRFPAYAEALTSYAAQAGQAGAINKRLEAATGVSDRLPHDRSETHSPSQGKVEYSRTMSSNPAYAFNNNGANSFKSVQKTVSKNLPTQSPNVYSVLGKTTPITQNTKKKTVGSQSESVSIVGYRIDHADRGTWLTDTKTWVEGRLETAQNHFTNLDWSAQVLNDVKFDLQVERIDEVQGCAE